jgi:hypothetical protein
MTKYLISFPGSARERVNSNVELLRFQGTYCRYPGK